MRGCNFVVQIKKVYNIKTRKHDEIKVTCDKLVQEGLEVCPKHHLFLEDAKLEEQRKSLARIQKRNQKALEREALAVSPLAAVNPEYKDKKSAAWIKGGYGL